MTKGNSLYAKLTRDLIPQYCKRIISDDETIQMLLSMLYQHTGIDYGNKTKAYSEGYDEGFADGIKKRNDTIAVAENNGYQRGYAEGRKVEHDHAFSLGENAGYERRKRHVQVSEEHFYAKGHNEGYQKGKAEGVAIGIKVKDEALNEYRKDGYNEGLKEGQFRHELALDIKWKEGYQVGKNEKAQAYHDGYSEGKQAGTKDAKKLMAVVDLKYPRTKLPNEVVKYSEKDMDVTYDKGYRDGFTKGGEIKDLAYIEGHRKGIEDGTKGKEKFATDRAEESYKKGHSQGIKDAWQKFDQGTTWDDGYEQGKRDADAKHQVLTAKAERQAHDAGFADGYGKGKQQGKQQGKKEVVDFINNMKVSQ